MNEMQYRFDEAWWQDGEDGAPAILTVEQSEEWLLHFETDAGMLTVPASDLDLAVSRLKRLA